MDAAELLDELVNFGQHDWIPLWMIVDDVESELNPDDHDETLDFTVALAESLLKRGFVAGDAPVKSAVRFTAWSNQEPSAIGEYIRREWEKRGGAPGWGDAPWFAMPPSLASHA